MKKKYLKPGCMLREVRGMQLLQGSMKVSNETVTNGGWAKESDTEGNSDNSFSVWED